MITKENQIKFFTEELKELEFSVKNKFNTLAKSLFEDGYLYVGQYRGFDEKRGNLFIDMPKGDKFHSPRLDQRLTCFTLKKGLEKPSTWLNRTYLDLLEGRNRSEIKVVDYISSERYGWITMIIREMDYEFIQQLQYNQILAFGPTIPPFEYLQNLLDFTKELTNVPSVHNKILNFEYSLNINRVPELLTEEIDIPESIIQDINTSSIYLLQGPPGTGKTYQIADLLCRLINKGSSVLLAAPTNKAAIEVCEKKFFDKLFEDGKVSKIPISFDDKIKYPKLQSTNRLQPIKGHLQLTTYYQFSKIWLEQTHTYDYVIIEEASQAYLTTIAAACKVGKKIIVVGDPKQILPIVSSNRYNLIPNISYLINGMSTLCSMEDFIYKRKIETRRLTERSTKYTNLFYGGTIVSKSIYSSIEDEMNVYSYTKEFSYTNGGPTLILFPKNINNIIDIMLSFLIRSINELTASKKNSIAVLTPYIETLVYLQQNLKEKTYNKNYVIETVDRIQGLDVDFCFYVVPRSSAFSFNLNRFNVASSRAKKCTYILAVEDYDKICVFHENVSSYLSKLKNDFSFMISEDLKLKRLLTI